MGVYSQGVGTPENFKGTHPIHRAHRAVVFAIAQLSCIVTLAAAV